MPIKKFKKIARAVFKEKNMTPKTKIKTLCKYIHLQYYKLSVCLNTYSLMKLKVLNGRKLFFCTCPIHSFENGIDSKGSSKSQIEGPYQLPVQNLRVLVGTNRPLKENWWLQTTKSKNHRTKNEYLSSFNLLSSQTGNPCYL